MFFNEMKTVRMKSSFAQWYFIASGKRKSESESESESIEVTSASEQWLYLYAHTVQFAQRWQELP